MGVIPESVKTLGRVVLKIKSTFKRPPMLMLAPGLVIEIDLARDSLLPAGSRVPLRIRRGIRQVAKVPARPERAIGVDIGRHDTADVALVISKQPYRQHPVSDPAVRIGRHFRHRNKWPRVRIRELEIIKRMRPRRRM